jgi:hypothetical protein
LQKREAFGDFADRENTDEQIVAVQGIDGLSNAGMDLGKPQLRKYEGIEQRPHSFASRIGERSRDKSSPSKLGPRAIRNSLKLRCFPVSFS